MLSILKLVPTWLMGQYETRDTNLEIIIASVKLPNRFKSWSMPPFGIPEYSTIEGKSWHVSMKSQESSTWFNYMPSIYLSSITNGALYSSLHIVTWCFGHWPCPKPPAIQLKKKRKRRELSPQSAETRMLNKEHLLEGNIDGLSCKNTTGRKFYQICGKWNNSI